MTTLDEAGNSDTFYDNITITYELQDSFIKWAEYRGFPQNLTQNFWDNYTEVVEYFFTAESGKSQLKKALELEQKNPDLNSEI